ncbi:Spo0E like sporulation regulatory protein [Clostridium cavendishii DSM 21758]|uniref:Spo0E like sporulation regulatory protein n=1 Tax=Clostridium cavendishii DSM 21758 TaxID=1121302 RepID=A0A1M6FCP9_9CLOT|nr:aspartyl-phosphate phosphatase Spo0E family protein [Clostridium cavendishii]SHI95457.1 Spo0E like sporulation regulatory protein [Clostridium cavendishii DSM 21758]
MNNIEEVNKKIEKLKQELQKLIDEKNDLLADEVIVASKTLDTALNEHNKLTNK